jgi:hypothetical protein
MLQLDVRGVVSLEELSHVDSTALNPADQLVAQVSAGCCAATTGNLLTRNFLLVCRPIDKLGPELFHLMRTRARSLLMPQQADHSWCGCSGLQTSASAFEHMFQSSKWTTSVYMGQRTLRWQ